MRFSCCRSTAFRIWHKFGWLAPTRNWASPCPGLMGTNRTRRILKPSQRNLTNPLNDDEDPRLNPRILLALKLPIVAIVGGIAAIIWLRGWSLAMTHVGFGVLTSSWFIALTDLPHNPARASDLFFSWFDSVYVGVEGLVISLGVACALRVPPFLAWAGFSMAAIGCASSFATSHPELNTFMIRFPTLHAFLFCSALGFYLGSLLRPPQSSI
jgi:hypothetical protein